jgi:hypothetical protein
MCARRTKLISLAISAESRSVKIVAWSRHTIISLIMRSVPCAEMVKSVTGKTVIIGKQLGLRIANAIKAEVKR